MRLNKDDFLKHTMNKLQFILEFQFNIELERNDGTWPQTPHHPVKENCLGHL